MENRVTIPIKASNGIQELNYTPFHLHIRSKLSVSGKVMPEVVEKSKRMSIADINMFFVFCATRDVMIELVFLSLDVSFCLKGLLR